MRKHNESIPEDPSWVDPRMRANATIVTAAAAFVDPHGQRVGGDVIVAKQVDLACGKLVTLGVNIHGSIPAMRGKLQKH